MKKASVVAMAMGMILVLAAFGVAGGDKNRGDNGTGSTYENGCEDQPCFADAPQPGPSLLTVTAAEEASALSDAEIGHLQFIREEEKMARDVYLVLYEAWGSPVFLNIAASEQRHMDAMARLLDFYGIEDPVTSDEIGAFTDPDIRDLYGDLVSRGLESEAEAMRAGGCIEEYDIADIWLAYDETDEIRIQRVYENLYEGSYNHLDAFVHNYELLTGEVYVQQLLSAEEFAYVMAFETRARQSQQSAGQGGR